MDPTAQGLLLLLLGVVIGGVTALAWRVSESQLRPAEPESDADAAVVPPGVSTVLGVLRSSALVIDEDDQVVQASAPAYSLGLVAEGRLRVPELQSMVQRVRRDGETRQADLEITRSTGQVTLVHARVAALSSRLVLVLAEDRTQERRVDEIRRDFVANVSHELKTPVGALTLLAEAVREAGGDAEAVELFASRMEVEATRLNRLVQQIIELSRLQGDAALHQGVPVDIGRVVESVVDAVAIEAKAKHVEVVHRCRPGLEVLGNAEQIGLALSNLVSNAVTYSKEHGSVRIACVPSTDLGKRKDDLADMVEITVSDEGVGIPADELDRIFERFYRVDPARHRSTGGTGLGLSIVKHVAASHGGSVTVWSKEGQGSTFTLRLPRSHSSAAANEPERTTP